MDAAQVQSALEAFLAETACAVVVENGEVIFEFATARYSISEEHGKTLLHIWSEERNIVRRVVGFERKSDALRVDAVRFGQQRPVKLEICRDRDRRSPAARKTARGAYLHRLARLLERRFPGWNVAQLSSAMDLERSFGPAHCRGLLKRGQSAFAVIGTSGEEPAPVIDASLTFGLLWLDCCREQQAGRAAIEGLRVIAPAGRSDVLKNRMAWLNRAAAKFELWEFDERSDELIEVDCADRGNIHTHLVQCTDQSAARERFAAEIDRIGALVPGAEVVVRSSAEVAFRLHGLEFARARLVAGEAFRSRPEITFGAGPYETALDETKEALFRDLVGRAARARQAGGDVRDPLYRMQPERWLESLVAGDVAALDSRLGAAPVYSQVPAFSASDRAMIDVLTATGEGRLAVLELKADEDIHLPLQGLDYWARVRWHQQRGEFTRFGYFARYELSGDDPLLLLVAPALHVHPATDTLLRYLAPEIDCTLVGIDERWREEVRVVFRKRAGQASAAKG